MSFKRLGDPMRQAALVPFLEAADTLEGQLVVFAVHKSVRLYPTKNEHLNEWKSHLGLRANWSAKAFEDAFLKAHLFSLLLAQWAWPKNDITWISDQDESVANARRLEDVHQLAARLTSLYVQHSMGVFAMNTTDVDGLGRELEDLVAVSDLAAGMVSEVSSQLSKGTTWSDLHQPKELYDGDVQYKSELLTDWFWYRDAKLGRTCIILDKVKNKMRVFKLDYLRL